MKRVTICAAVSVAGLALASPGLAGGMQQTIEEPVIVAPAPVDTGGDWTGAYAGVTLGYADVNGTGTVDGDGEFYGLHIGYDYDFGQFVLGGELEYDVMDISLGGVTDLDSVARLKVRGGYDLGRTLLYLTAGAAEADTSSVGSDTGGFAGLGVTYRVNDTFYLGGEVLGHQFDDFNQTGVDLDATTLSIRGGVRF